MKSKIKKHKTLLLTTLICLLPLVFSIALYGRLPEMMATHWDSEDQVNGYLPRFTAAVLLPVFMAFLNVIAHVSMDHDPKRKNSAPILILIGKWTVPVVSLLAMTQTLLWNIGYKFPISKSVMVLCGVLFILIGNYLPKCKQNYTVGIKLPWTLNSESNWNRTHHLAGYLWILGGLVMIVGGWFRIGAWILALLLLITLIPCVYSFYLYRKES